MPVLPTDLPLGNGLSSMLLRASHWLTRQFGAGGREFSGDNALGTMALIDERLRPQAPMPRDDIEIMTRLNLSNMGLRNAQRVTAESHPELYGAWQALCQRAGYGGRVPQLIVTESNMANAMEITDNEMVITTGLLKMLDLREVAGVLAHELGHARRDHTGVRMASMATFGGAGALLGNFVGKLGGENPYGLAGKYFGWLGKPGRWVDKHFFTELPHAGLPRQSSLLGYIAYIAVGMGIGNVAANQIAVKPTELQADLDGVAISGDGEALASALTKMQAADTRGPLSRWFGYLKSGYPTVEERVANIRRAMAERPADPVPAVLGPVPGAQVHSAALAGQGITADDSMARMR